MSELSDYKRLVEAPAIQRYEATIKAQHAEIERLTRERDRLVYALRAAREK